VANFFSACKYLC